MAKDNDTKLKFIELRAKGWSYDKIAKELNVSKSTLIQWSKEFELEIKNFRNIELESLREQFMLDKAKKLEFSREIFDKLIENLRSRNFDDIPSDKLVNLILSLLDKLENSGEINFVEEASTINLDFLGTKTWSG